MGTSTMLQVLILLVLESVVQHDESSHRGLCEIQEGAREVANLATDAAGRKHAQQRVGQIGGP